MLKHTSSHVSQGPEDVCKSTDSRTLPHTVVPPEPCAQSTGAVSIERDGDTEGLDSCPGSAANLECDLRSIPYPLGLHLFCFKMKTILPGYLPQDCWVTSVRGRVGREHPCNVTHIGLYRDEHHYFRHSGQEDRH